MHIVQVSLIISSQILVYKIFYSLGYIAEEYRANAYTSMALLLIGQIFAAVFSIKNNKD